jgi:hypothetical protein
MKDFKFFGVRPTPDGKMAGVNSYTDTGSMNQPRTYYYMVYAISEQVSLFPDFHFQSSGRMPNSSD